ncbi:hypothetical protein FRB96_000602 [Tulasnella sp. 330]|nr:hypothetical protein FRB96_000602 [Tulasnella sp. 330]KAG8873898.1 hypothetical protein FRB98_008722 [Tulasnella sp. 332]
MSYGSKDWQSWCLEEQEGIHGPHYITTYNIRANVPPPIDDFMDANAYSNGLSEVVLGKAIKQHNLPRDEIVVMTKVCFVVNEDLTGSYTFAFLSEQQMHERRYANKFGLSRKHIFDSVKKSLERLQLDYVDVLQCHRFDYNTSIEETMQALHDVVKAGHARYIGMSSCYAWQFHKMQNYARSNGLTEFISMQNFHNAVYREEEREMVPLLQDLGIGMIPWSPLAIGFLTRPLGQNNTNREAAMGSINALYIGDPTKMTFLAKINQRVAAIAETRSVSMAQVAVAWSLSKPFVTAPVVGTTSFEKLKDLCAAVNLRLTAEELKSIDDLYEPRGIVGHT